MSEMNYLQGVELHQFVESMTLEECGVETLAMIDSEWDAISEAVKYSDVSLFEAELLGLEEAEGEGGSFIDKLKALGQKIIAFLKKIASYIMGYISKFLATFEQIIRKEEGKAKDKARVLRGADKLAEAGKDLELYGLMITNPGWQPGYVRLKSRLESQYKIGTMTMEDLAGHVDSLKNDANSFGDTARGLLLGKGPVASGDFKAAIMKEMTGEEGPGKHVFEAAKIKNAAASACDAVAKAKEHKAEIKKSYEDIKKAINDEIKVIAKLTSDARKYDKEQDDKKRAAYNAVKFTGDIYKIGGGVMTAANAAFTSVIAADYRLNAQLVNRCWLAGGSEASLKKEAKKAQKQAAEEYAAAGATVDESAEVETTQESVESIFGMDLI